MMKIRNQTVSVCTRMSCANKRIQPTVNPLRRFVHFASLNYCTKHRAGLPAADAGRYVR